MNAPSPPNETDVLDQLFSDFFKAELKQPWPEAPVSGTNTHASEPSELVTTHTAESVRNTPAAPAPARDHTARARFTLAASVALVLGTGWFLADGYEPARHAPGAVPVLNGPGMLSGSGAQGEKGSALHEIQKHKLKEAPKDNGDIKFEKIGD